MAITGSLQLMINYNIARLGDAKYLKLIIIYGSYLLGILYKYYYVRMKTVLYCEFINFYYRPN